MKKPLNLSNRTIFLLMVAVVLFWYTGKHYNVYSNIFIGGLFELLSLPMIVLPVFLAGLASWNLFRSKGMDSVWAVLALVLFGMGVWQIVYN